MCIVGTKTTISLELASVVARDTLSSKLYEYLHNIQPQLAFLES
jgi:hypothetical protein